MNHSQSNTVTIGVWHERESRELTHCPSYYAADYETLRTQVGDYDLRVTFEGGYRVPMPYWLLARIDAVRVSGALYSGFGGVNFASTPLAPGERIHYGVQMYVYQLCGLVDSGQVRLQPGCEWLLAPKPWEAPGAPRTWDAVQALCLQKTTAASTAPEEESDHVQATKR